MSKFYSKTTNGFYDPEITTSIPSDAVEITDELWATLFANQSKGQIITADANGYPINVAPTVTQAETIDIISIDIQQVLDTGAKKWGYDSIAAAASYATSSNAQYAADAKALIDWRDTVWAWAIAKFPSVTPGENPSTFMADMPVQPVQPVVS